MDKIYLTEICRPKQWKTISTANLYDVGYPVYGANGKIGFYDKYTHEFPTVLITCRGATCGTLNISEPKSYVNGNAMALDNLSKNYSLKYLYYILKARGLNDVISGSAQPQITRENLSKVKIPNPKLSTQQKIAAILDKADELRQYNKQLIEKYDALTQSLFLDMFGDPVNNEKGWEKMELNKFGKIITGNTPPRNDSENYSSNFIEWLKTDNINDKFVNVTQAKEYLSEKGYSKARFVENGALLVACIAGSIESIGRASLTDRKVSFNQQINAIQPFDDVNPKYLYNLFRISKKHIQNHASNGMKRMLTKGEFEKILMIKPTLGIQNQFAERVHLIENQKLQVQDALAKSEDLFQSLLQRAFKGELN